MASRRSLPPSVQISRWSKRTPLGVVVAMLLIVATLLGRSGGDDGDDFQTYHNKIFTVVEVVDGDTVDIDQPDGKFPDTRIRMWGVDTPEVAGSPAGEMYFGKEASEFTKQTLANRKVRVLLSTRRTRDKYGRLLAYLELLESGDSFNELLIAEGYGYADWRFDHPLKMQYKSVERKARRAGLGLWANVTPDQFPPWRERMERELDYKP